MLSSVAASAENNASIFQKNEAATRAALIDPVLRALGWDTANVQMVEPEKSLGTELRVDYLLRDSAGQPALVIEAKCLESSLDKYSYVGKILGYALALNVQTVCITDGVHWHIHSNLQQGKSEPIAFALTADALLPAAMQLVQCLDAALCGHGLTQPAAHNPASTMQAAPQPIPLNLTPTKASKQSTQPKKQPTSAATFIELTQLQLASLAPGQKPKQLRLPNGTVKAINTWKDILLEVCRLVLQDNSRLVIPLADKAGKTRFLFSNDKPEKGSSTKASYQGKPLFIGTHYSAADCIANAVYAAKQIPQHQRATTIAVAF
ncbi:MAG TPA: hypothetical protein VF629_20685 [Hymenobacter sp.]|jgi:hypothetical protein|uniref:hypothetical protein n=1 Tax=Hymenobacter sp. TaxID=1898978 RepID=UPI002EDAC230